MNRDAVVAMLELIARFQTECGVRDVTPALVGYAAGRLELPTGAEFTQPGDAVAVLDELRRRAPAEAA